MITRFAPSPTGPLHLGHAYSAILAHDMAQAAAGTFLLRIDDLDASRVRAEWETQIYQDLEWLGLSWPAEVRRESAHAAEYRQAVDKLSTLGVLYPCGCRRRDIAAAVSAPQENVPTHGPDGLIYPGTCRHRNMADLQPDDVVRLNMSKALKTIDLKGFTERGPIHSGRYGLSNALQSTIGDVVLTRRDMAAAYHLAVVIDDAAQGVTHVVRGEDLFDATFIHVLLQNLLGLPTPIYHHHRLIRDENGKRLAKRDDAKAIRRFRDEGYTPTDIRRMVGL